MSGVPVNYTALTSVNGSVIDEGDPPDYQVVDYVIIAFCLLITAVGVPVNAVAFRRVINELRHSHSPSRLTYLSLNLLLANLFVVIFASFGKALWHITVQWRAGNVLCKLYKFSETQSAYLLSNIIVAIGLDMLGIVRRPFGSGQRRVKWLLVGCWVLSVLASAPQLYFWETVAPFERFHPGWEQCTFYQRTAYTSLMSNATDFDGYLSLLKTYSLFHTLTVFWFPLAILIPCYVVILFLIAKSSQRQDRLTQRTVFLNGTKEPNNGSAPAKADVNSSCHQNSASSVQSQHAPFLKKKNHSGLSPLVYSHPKNHAKEHSRRRRQKTIKLAGSVIGLYIATWLPYQIISIWGIIDLEAHDSNQQYIQWLYFLYLANSCINPFIYAFKIKPETTFIKGALWSSHRRLISQFSQRFNENDVLNMANSSVRSTYDFGKTNETTNV